MSWKRNLSQKGGFWGDARWYDLHLHERLPEAEEALRELILALPPLGRGSLVCDLGAGTGRSAVGILSAYPEAAVVMIDADEGRLETARRRCLHCLRARDDIGVAAETAGSASSPTSVRTIQTRLDWSDGKIGGGPYDAIVAMQTFRHIVSPPAHYSGGADDTKATPADTSITRRYAAVFAAALCSLTAGGHVLFGDHVQDGHPACFEMLRLLEEAGFVDCDVAFRRREWFVLGGRRPCDVASGPRE